MRQTRSALEGLNGITFPYEEDDAYACRFGFELQGVRLDPKLANTATSSVVTGGVAPSRVVQFGDMTSDDEAAEKPEQGEPSRELHEHEPAPDKPEAKRPWSFIGRRFTGGIPFIKKTPPR